MSLDELCVDSSVRSVSEIGVIMQSVYIPSAIALMGKIKEKYMSKRMNEDSMVI